MMTCVTSSCAISVLTGSPLHRPTKFSVVLGTIFPYSPMMIRPAGDPPISTSKNTFSVIAAFAQGRQRDEKCARSAENEAMSKQNKDICLERQRRGEKRVLKTGGIHRYGKICRLGEIRLRLLSSGQGRTRVKRGKGSL